MMDTLPNIISKSIEYLNRLENDKDNRYSWKFVNAESGFIVINRQLQASPKNNYKQRAGSPDALL